MFSLPAVIYLCKGEDDTIIERKGSEEEPFEFTTQEGKKLLLFMIMDYAYLSGNCYEPFAACVLFLSSAFNLCTALCIFRTSTRGSRKSNNDNEKGRTSSCNRSCRISMRL